MSKSSTRTLAAGGANEKERRRAERAARFRAREFLHEFSSLPRLRRCSFRPIDRQAGVGVAVGDGVAHFRGVQLCGSIHSCPVCAPKIREARAGEINTAACEHLSRGGGLVFVTLTLPHAAHHKLAPLVDTIADGWRRIWQGRSGQERRKLFGIDGYVRALDFTYGGNGWHPHLHVLLFLEGPADELTCEMLTESLLGTWASWCASKGYGRPSRAHGVKVDPVRTRPELGGYLAKIDDGWHAGRELSRADLKRGRSSRTPWQILRDAQENGDADDLALWREYEKATVGRRCITWSRGLKARFAIAEVDDQELADAEVGGVLVAQIPGDVWAKLRRHRGLTTRLLEGAERGGYLGVVEAVAEVAPMWARAIGRPPD